MVCCLLSVVCCLLFVVYEIASLFCCFFVCCRRSNVCASMKRRIKREDCPATEGVTLCSRRSHSTGLKKRFGYFKFGNKSHPSDISTCYRSFHWHAALAGISCHTPTGIAKFSTKNSTDSRWSACMFSAVRLPSSSDNQTGMEQPHGPHDDCWNDKPVVSQKLYSHRNGSTK